MRGKKKIAIFMCVVLASLILEHRVWAEGTPEPINENQLYARSAVLMDADSGRVLYEKNGGEIMPMASTTKIMTLIVALENSNPDEIVEISEYAASMPDVQLNLRTNETYRLGDLYYSLMLQSHNDTAVAIAEHVGGSVEGFAALMNAKARDIGCYDTYYITPNGLDSTDIGSGKVHSTTATDLARVMRYCTTQSPQKEEFLKITGTKSYSFSDTDGICSFTVINANAFLNMMDGAFSGKTGFTNDAGYCYVGALERDGKSFVVALLACGWPNNKTYKWKDTTKLMEYGLANYTYEDIWEEIKFSDVLVANGISESENLSKPALLDVGFGSKEDSLEFLVNQRDVIDINIQLPDRLEAPVEMGSMVGSVEYEINGNMVAAYPIVAKEMVKVINFPWCFIHILEKYF